MFKSISKRNLWTVAKNATLTVAVVLGFSVAAKAEDTKNIETLQVSCNPFASSELNTQCNSNSSIDSQGDQIAQTRRGRRRKSKVQGYYGGFSLGVGFPSGGVTPQSDIINVLEGAATDADVGSGFSEIEYNTGFNGSVFGGINFSKNLAADLEFQAGFGSGDADNFNSDFDQLFDVFRNPEGGVIDPIATGDLNAEVDYSSFALYINPRFNLPVSEKFSVFVSPGIGLSQTNVNYKADSNAQFNENFGTLIGVDQEVVDTVNRELEELDSDRDSSRTGISFQIKAGASYQISDTIGIFGQFRYATLPTESNDEFDPDSLNAFSTQGGLTFNF